MAYREVLSVEIREIIRRWQAGFSQRRIARGTGLSRQTVRRYIEAAEAAGLRPGGPEPGEEHLADDPEACARSLGVAAVYALHEGEFVSYILGAPDFVNRSFRELFADGLPSITPLVARSDAPGGAIPR